jgi:hypothetical protein
MLRSARTQPFRCVSERPLVPQSVPVERERRGTKFWAPATTITPENPKSAPKKDQIPIFLMKLKKNLLIYLDFTKISLTFVFIFKKKYKGQEHDRLQGYHFFPFRDTFSKQKGVFLLIFFYPT